MKNKFLLYVCFCLFVPGCLPSIAQQTEVPLINILSEVQKRFKVQFNYASDLVEGRRLEPPEDSIDLEATLNYLREKTALSYHFVSDAIIAIKGRTFKLCGYVKDKDSGEPLSFTTIQNDKLGVISDEEGFFELDYGSDSEVIVIRHIGHKPIRREARFFGQGKCATVYMVAEEQQLPEIVLSDYLIRGIDKLDNGSFQIDFDRFRILPGLVDEDVLQSVQALPGIQSINETVSDISIRGGSNDQNLILWDGIKMYQSGHFFGLISMYNPQITGKVNLRKNGSPVADTDGVSGTISMKTSEQLNPSFKGNVGINLVDANAFVDTPISRNASIQLAARKAINDLLETPTYSEYFDRIAQGTEIEQSNGEVSNSDIGFDFYDASFRLLWYPSDKDRLRLNFINTANDLVFNESTAIGGMERIRQSSLDQRSIAGGLNYQRKWSENLTTELQLYETDYTLRAINANVLENQRFLQENIVSETGIKLLAANRIGETVRLTGGYHFVETKVTNLDDVDNPLFRRLEGEVLRTHAVFSEIGWVSLSGKTRFNGGLRVNYLDKFEKLIWEPRLSLNHNFFEGFNLEVLGEFKNQNTSQIVNFQNDFLGIEKRRWQLSDDQAIPVIQGKQGSLGLSYGSSGWLFNAVGFLKEVRGLTTQSQGFQDQYEFVRTSGKYDASGMDFLLRKQLEPLNFWLSYSYLKSDYRFEELPETDFRSNFDITHAVSLGIAYATRRFRLAAGLNWRTGRPFTRLRENDEVVNGELNYGPANTSRLSDFFRVDLSSIYRIALGNKGTAQIGFSVWNLLNRENQINTFYRINTLNQAEQVVQNSLGITPNALLRLYLN